MRVDYDWLWKRNTVRVARPRKGTSRWWVEKPQSSTEVEAWWALRPGYCAPKPMLLWFDPCNLCFHFRKMWLVFGLFLILVTVFNGKGSRILDTGGWRAREELETPSALPNSAIPTSRLLLRLLHAASSPVSIHYVRSSHQPHRLLSVGCQVKHVCTSCPHITACRFSETRIYKP